MSPAGEASKPVGLVRRVRGFTLIELMVTVAVIIILSIIAVPSFQAQRQRAAISGAADELLSFWNQSRFEAVKRNAMVKVGVVQTNSGAQFCLGAATTTNPGDTTPCDCTVETPSDATLTCDVARFPSDMSAGQEQWRGATLAGVTLGGGTNLTNIEPAVMEPKRTALTVTADDGSITILSPRGPNSYRMNLHVDKFGRPYLCESTSSVHKMSGYADRHCAD